MVSDSDERDRKAKRLKAHMQVGQKTEAEKKEEERHQAILDSAQRDRTIAISSIIATICIGLLGLYLQDKQTVPSSQSSNTEHSSLPGPQTNTQSNTPPVIDLEGQKKTDYVHPFRVRVISLIGNQKTKTVILTVEAINTSSKSFSAGTYPNLCTIWASGSMDQYPGTLASFGSNKYSKDPISVEVSAGDQAIIKVQFEDVSIDVKMAYSLDLSFPPGGGIFDKIPIEWLP